MTWVEEDDGLQRCVLVLVYLDVLEGLHQLVQDPVGDPENLRFGAVPVDHAAVPCRIGARRQRQSHVEETNT